MIEWINKDYKVVNISQIKFNNWLKKINPAESYEICMNIEKKVTLILDSEELIDTEIHKITRTYLKLKHKKY